VVLNIFPIFAEDDVSLLSLEIVLVVYIKIDLKRMTFLSDPFLEMRNQSLPGTFAMQIGTDHSHLILPWWF